jgi:hypothetical protein
MFRWLNNRKRIKELERAIRAANSWVQCNEGVRLIYYYEDWMDEQREFDIIKELIDV